MRRIAIAGLALLLLGSPRYAMCQDPPKAAVCMQQNMDIMISGSLGDIISQHVDKMFKEGYATYLAEYDFDHGHLLGGGGKSYDSLDDYLSDIKAVLYHSDEDIRRWDPNRYDNLSRSIVGFRDGSLMPAETMVDVQDEKAFCTSQAFHNYPGYGTIFPADLAKDYPLLDAGGGRSCDGTSPPMIMIDGAPYTTNAQFTLEESPNSRYSTSGHKYDIILSFRCR